MTDSARQGTEPGLEPLLGRAEALLGQAAVLALGLDDLGAIELPPPTTQADQAQLRAIATLYLASELEAAGVITAAEDLARLTRSGALRSDLGRAADLIQEFWQGRNDRLSAAERTGFFAALFGGTANEYADTPANVRFEDDLIDLCEALYKLDLGAANVSWGGVAQQARVRAAAQRLLGGLQRAAGGMTFVAQEVIGTLRQALAILGDSAVQAAFAVRRLWDVVDAVDRLMRRRPRREHALRVRRGQAGMTVLAWLAEGAPLLASNRPLVGLDHPVIGAALDWMEASLALTESAPVQAPTAAPGFPASPWAAIAG